MASGAQVAQALQRLAELTLRHRLPSAFLFTENVRAGGLLSYGPADSEAEIMDARFADIVDRILRGAKPADIPVDRPSRYELVINLKAAKALGLTIPPSLVGRADEVIQ